MMIEKNNGKSVVLFLYSNSQRNGQKGDMSILHKLKRIKRFLRAAADENVTTFCVA